MTQFLDKAFEWARDDDVELRRAIRRLAWLTVQEAYEMLENGRPQDKITLISRLATPMMRALGEEDQGGREIDEMRRDFSELMARLSGGHPAPDQQPEDSGQELHHFPTDTELGAAGVPPELPRTGRREQTSPHRRPEGPSTRR